MGVIHKPHEDLFPSLGLLKECRFIWGASYSKARLVPPFTGLELTRQIIPFLLHTNSLFYISHLQTTSKNPKSINSESQLTDCRLKFTIQVFITPPEKF